MFKLMGLADWGSAVCFRHFRPEKRTVSTYEAESGSNDVVFAGSISGGKGGSGCGDYSDYSFKK